MIGALARDLEERGLQSLLVLATSSRDPDLAGFVGSVHLGEAVLVVTPDGETHLAYLTAMERQEAAASGCRLIDPEALEVGELRQTSPTSGEFWQAVVTRVLELCSAAPGKVAVAGRLPVGPALEVCRSLERRGWRCVSGQELIRLWRKPKSEAQVVNARRAARGACAALREVAALLVATSSRDGELWLEGERLKVSRLRRAISAALAALELEQPEGNIVAAGGDAAVPHTQGSSERILRPGEAIIVDLFPRAGLFADCTRTFCVGPPPERLARAHETVAAVLERSHQEVKVGRRGWELQRIASDLFEEAGYPTLLTAPGTTIGYVHGLGHGVGFELHEYPSFGKGAGAEGVLECGDLFTLEPGLYDPPAGWGVRLEDCCWLSRAEGLVNLTPLPRALDPRVWVEGD